MKSDVSTLHGKKIAVIVTEVDKGNSETAVFTGIARWTGDSLVMMRGDTEPPFDIQPEWYERIKPVKEEVRSILLGAEYTFTLLMGVLPETGDRESFQATGLRWPGSGLGKEESDNSSE